MLSITQNSALATQVIGLYLPFSTPQLTIGLLLLLHDMADYWCCIELKFFLLPLVLFVVACGCLLLLLVSAPTAYYQTTIATVYKYQ